VPKGLAVVLTSLLLAGVLVVLLGVLGLSGTRLIQVLPHYQERALAFREDLEALLLAWGIQSERIFSSELVDPNRLLGLAAGFLSGLGQALSQVLLLILIVAFFLAERGIRDQTFHPGGTAARVASDVRQYLIITALSGLGFSLLAYVLMLAVGTDLALVWAVLAFIMNFVPNIGIILSVIPPVLLTLLELSWQRALVVLAAFLVLNFVVDNLIKPRFMQSGLDVPPLVGLLSLVVWAYLLGPIGTLLALPLTIAIRRVLEDADLAVPGLSATAGSAP
jgi:predicted PurR-regulated permease PerM